MLDVVSVGCCGFAMSMLLCIDHSIIAQVDPWVYLIWRMFHQDHWVAEEWPILVDYEGCPNATVAVGTLKQLSMAEMNGMGVQNDQSEIAASQLHAVLEEYQCPEDSSENQNNEE